MSEQRKVILSYSFRVFGLVYISRLFCSINHVISEQLTSSERYMEKNGGTGLIVPGSRLVSAVIAVSDISVQSAI